LLLLLTTRDLAYVVYGNYASVRLDGKVHGGGGGGGGLPHVQYVCEVPPRTPCSGVYPRFETVPEGWVRSSCVRGTPVRFLF